MNLDHILRWELKRGSHEFPGPAGGTCINEAAIVAAGFEYRKVNSHEDCPPCFCPVLSQFAIDVNDRLPDADRKALMPLVVRLAGSKDEREWVERARAEFIVREFEPALDRLIPAMRDILRYGSPDAGMSYATARDRLDQAARLKLPLDKIRCFSDGLLRLSYALSEIGRVQLAPLVGPALLADYDLNAEQPLAMEVEEHSARSLWLTAAEALSRAFEIGNRAPTVETALVVERMETAKAEARERVIA